MNNATFLKFKNTTLDNHASIDTWKTDIPDNQMSRFLFGQDAAKKVAPLSFLPFSQQSFGILI